MSTRRNFLGAILSAAMAPAIVKSSSLMKIAAPKPSYLVLHGDGLHDDTKALQHLFSGGLVMSSGGVLLGGNAKRLCVPSGDFLISETLHATNCEFEWSNAVITNTNPNGAVFEFGYKGLVNRTRDIVFTGSRT